MLGWLSAIASLVVLARVFWVLGRDAGIIIERDRMRDISHHHHTCLCSQCIKVRPFRCTCHGLKDCPSARRMIIEDNGHSMMCDCEDCIRIYGG